MRPNLLCYNNHDLRLLHSFCTAPSSGFGDMKNGFFAYNFWADWPKITRLVSLDSGVEPRDGQGWPWPPLTKAWPSLWSPHSQLQFLPLFFLTRNVYIKMLNRRISLQPQQTRDFSDTQFNFASASSANQTSSERNMGQMSCWLPPFFTFLHMRIHFPLYRVQFRYDRTVAINLFWQLIECEIFTVYFF